MNIITRIALSLSLIALVAQPMQAVSAKKVATVAGYAALTCASGLLFLAGIQCVKDRTRCKETIQVQQSRIDKARAAISAVDKSPEKFESIIDTERSTGNFEIASPSGEGIKRAAHSTIEDCTVCITERQNTQRKMTIASPSCFCLAGLALYYGLSGLKTEICPDFKPIEWIKNKIGMNTKKTQQAT